MNKQMCSAVVELLCLPLEATVQIPSWFIFFQLYLFLFFQFILVRLFLSLSLCPHCKVTPNKAALAARAAAGDLAS